MKRNPTILTLLALVFLAAACGSDSDSTDVGDTSAPDAPSTDAPQDSVPPDTEPVDSDLPLGGGNLPIVTLDITITHPEVDNISYSISCLGDTATITGAAQGLNDFTACERLGDSAVRERLVNGAPADQACTEQYGGPDIAKIVGSYDGVEGEPVDTTIDRANGCGIDDWDRLLAGVLPQALGIIDS